jgi:uncharacterized membrane protein
MRITFLNFQLTRDTSNNNFKACIGAAKVLICFVPSLIGSVGLYYGINGLIKKDENFQKYTIFIVGSSITIATVLICTIPFWFKKQT